MFLLDSYRLQSSNITFYIWTTLFNFINLFLCVEIISWGFPYLSFKSSHAWIQVSLVRWKFSTACKRAHSKSPIKYVNFAVLDILSFLCTAALKYYSNCFHFIMSPSSFCNTNFGNLATVCILKLSMLWL